MIEGILRARFMPSKNRKRKAASVFYKHIQEIKSILYVKVLHNLQYFLASFVKCVHCLFFFFNTTQTLDHIPSSLGN